MKNALAYYSAGVVVVNSKPLRVSKIVQIGENSPNLAALAPAWSKNGFN
jgi:hypothetical protein